MTNTKNKFKLLREKLRMTQVQMSNFLDISLETWQSYEEDINSQPDDWIKQLVFEKISKKLEDTKVLPIEIDEDATIIHNELDQELLDGILKPTDIIKAVIVDNHLIDWYYADDTNYYDISDKANMVTLSVRELMQYIEQKHFEKYEK